jgi:hypothetical protein
MFRTEVVEESEKYTFYVQYTFSIALTAFKIVQQRGFYDCISEFACSVVISEAITIKENEKSLLKLVFINIRFIVVLGYSRTLKYILNNLYAYILSLINVCDNLFSV